MDEPQTMLSHLPFRWYISRSVEQEELSIRPNVLAKRHERRKIDLTPCYASGILTRCEPETQEERNLYVQLAVEVDDGEAMSLAIAASRQWALSTDDIAARKVALRLGLITYATPQLVRLWAERTNAANQQISAAIIRIETLARYIPNRTMPDSDWWVERRKG